MLQRLLRLFAPFLMLGFAAGPVIGDAIGGGDAGSGDSGSSDGGDDAGTVGQTDDGSGETAAGEDEGITSDGDDGGTADGQQSDPNALVDLGDGRQVPAKFKKLFDLAKKAGVEKEAKQLFFANQRLAKAIPGGVNAAIELAQTVEEIGGVEAIQQLQDDIGTYSQDAEMFNSGDPRWVESGFKENPEASIKAFAHSLDYVSEHHPEHYDHMMAKVIVNDLANLDVREIHAMLAGIKDNPRAAALAKQLADYYNSRLETSRNAPEKKPDTQNKALTEREKQVEQREMNVRFQEVNKGAFSHLKSTVTNALTLEAKSAGVDLQKLSKEYPGEWRDLLNDIHQRIMKQASKDTRFLDKYYALVKKGDLKRAEQAINQKHTRIIETTDVVKEAIADRGLFRSKKTARTADATGTRTNTTETQTAGWTRVSKRPANSDINWGKTTQAMQLDGKYILNDGKKVVVQY